MPRRPRRVDPDEQLALTEHLDELRSRLIVSVSVLVVVIAAVFWQWREIFAWLLTPASDALGEKASVLQTGPTDAFFTAFSLSLDIAVLVTLPMLTYQIYAFAIPAFSREHHRRIRSLALMIPCLFVLGVAFGWFLVVPPALSFLLTFGGSDFKVQLRANEYLQFITLLLLAMGVIFEMPAIMYTLAKMRIVSARMMRRTWRYAIVILALVAAVLPGADPVSFVFEFVPLLVLYGLSYVLVKGVDRRRAEDDDEGRRSDWD